MYAIGSTKGATSLKQIGDGILQLREKCRRAFDKSAMNFLPPPHNPPLSGPNRAKCIIYNPQLTLLSLRQTLVLKH